MMLVDNKIYLSDLENMAQKMTGNLVKAVVDIEKNIMVVDAEMHADEEEFLLENGSQQEFLWGINLYPSLVNTDDFIEFDSMINVRPSAHNRSRGVDDILIQKKIISIVNNLVKQ